MVRSQDTVAAAGTECPHPPRPVFVLDDVASLPPAGEAAEWLLAHWESCWKSALPGLVLVDQRLHSRLVDHLHRRLTAVPAVSVPSESFPRLADLVRAALDGGATLIVGGQSSGPSQWQPTMFVNLLAASPLLHPDAPSAPILGIMRVSESMPAAPILQQLTTAEANLQIHRPAPTVA